MEGNGLRKEVLINALVFCCLKGKDKTSYRYTDFTHYNQSSLK